MGSPEERIVARLISKLKDSNYAEIAMDTLFGNLSSGPFADSLYNAMISEDDEVIRWQITCALGYMRDKRVVPILVETLDAGGRYSQRREIAGDILSKLEPAIAEQLLIKALGEDDYRIRVFATAQLGRIGSPVALTHVTKMLEDTDSTVRRFANRALNIDAQSLSAKTNKTSYTSADIEHYITELRHDSETVRYTAAGILHDIGDERAIEPLIARLSDEDGSVREVAVFALERLGDERALPALQWIKENDDYEDFEGRKISQHAAEAIAYIKTREYILKGKEFYK